MTARRRWIAFALAVPLATRLGVLRELLAAGKLEKGVYRVRGDARVNGVLAREGMDVKAGDLITTGADGELLWQRDLGALDAGWFYDASYQWGFASSPVIYDGLVIVQADVQEGSFIAAYDLETGREVWKTERDEIPTWATPTASASTRAGTPSSRPKRRRGAPAARKRAGRTTDPVASNTPTGT